MDFATLTADEFAALDAEGLATLPLEDTSSSSSGSSASSLSSLSSASSDSSSSFSSASSASSNSSSSLSSASSGSSDSSSSLSSASSFSSESSSSTDPFVPQPTVRRAVTLDSLDYGDDIIVQGKPFALELDDLDPDATVTLFAEGIEVGTGTITGPDEVTFVLDLPLGRYDVTVVQTVDGLESVPSQSHAVRVNSPSNAVPTLAPPTITPGNITSYHYPVRVRITSNIPGALIFYTVDGTGFAQPTERYVNGFEVSQTAVVKSRVVYRGLSSKVAKAVIRIIR